MIGYIDYVNGPEFVECPAPEQFPYSVTFKTPGCAHITVNAMGSNPRAAKCNAALQLRDQGYSRQCHMWPATVRRI